MTSLGKSVTLVGLSIFTLGTLIWITAGSWQWFAGGAAVFVSSLIASIVLSAETKNTRHHNSPPSPTLYTNNNINELREPSRPTQERIDDDTPGPKTL